MWVFFGPAFSLAAVDVEEVTTKFVAVLKDLAALFADEVGVDVEVVVSVLAVDFESVIGWEVKVVVRVFVTVKVGAVLSGAESWVGALKMWN